MRDPELEYRNFKKFIPAVIGIFILLIGVQAGLVIEKKLIPSQTSADTFSLDDQQATIQAIAKVKPAVVSIIIYGNQDVKKLDAVTGQITDDRSRVKFGEGSGFLISSDGLILTNKHVADIAPNGIGEYRIILNSGKEYYAQFIGGDPVNDLAVLKIFDKNLPFVTLGDSDKLAVGTTVMAIGNALGQYQNTVTKGIVSGLGRSVVAGDQYSGQTEALDSVVQTDAEINPGNSGGPLIDLNGNVVGINTAIDQGGVSIGFAIPINDAKQVISSVKTIGKISVARLGVSYLMLNEEIARDNNLPRNTGAWISSSQEGVSAVVPGSPSEKAGLKDGDIIFEVDGKKVEDGKTLLSFVQRYKPGQKIGFKVQRGDKTLVIVATLDEAK